jgi:hypothetical protein
MFEYDWAVPGNDSVQIIGKCTNADVRRRMDLALSIMVNIILILPLIHIVLMNTPT